MKIHNPNNSATWLSTKKTDADWKVIQPRLSAGATHADWTAVVQDFYRDRLESRYLGPIRLISNSGNRNGEGFAIVAIQCSLVEFLQSCFEGMNYVYDNPRPPYEYNKSGDMFASFLRDHEPFIGTFDEILANDFYKSVRCGVLHEARTKGGWRIHVRSGSAKIVDKTDRILYRDDFQDALQTFINSYCHDVPKTPVLQQAFIRKFDHLCS